MMSERALMLLCIAVLVTIAALRPWSGGLILYFVTLPFAILAAGLIVEMLYPHEQRRSRR